MAEHLFVENRIRFAIDDLLHRGLLPATSKWLMEQRLAVIGTEEESAFWHRDIYTCDSIVRNRNVSNLRGRAKVRIASPSILALASDREISEEGYINLTDDEFASIPGRQISTGLITSSNGMPSLSEAENNPFWIAFAQGDRQLVREYRDAVAEFLSRANTRNETRGMEVLPPPVGRQPSRFNFEGAVQHQKWNTKYYETGAHAGALAYGMGFDTLFLGATPEDLGLARVSDKTVQSIAEKAFAVVEPFISKNDLGEVRKNLNKYTVLELSVGRRSFRDIADTAYESIEEFLSPYVAEKVKTELTQSYRQSLTER